LPITDRSTRYSEPVNVCQYTNTKLLNITQSTVHHLKAGLATVRTALGLGCYRVNGLAALAMSWSTGSGHYAGRFP